jgi:hypothetical protein
MTDSAARAGERCARRTGRIWRTGQSSLEVDIKGDEVKFNFYDFAAASNI